MQLASVNPVLTAWMASSRANTGSLVLSFSGRHEQNLVKVEHVVANRSDLLLNVRTRQEYRAGAS